ncbi:MAG: VIT1/CCC1 transporter family protein [Anaerolineales bacterium]|jgi:predicted membrane protein (TIGR00267 family)
MNSIRSALKRLREFDALVGINEIARRYFAMNAFDGALTIIGVVMGNLVAGVGNTRIVISTGLSTSIAMGISGLWGAYLTESAERDREMDELSRVTLVEMKKTRIGRASRLAVLIVALVDGISPFMTAVIILIPFFFASLFPSLQTVYFTSLTVALVVLFLLGVFLGRVSGKSWIGFGIRTVLAGIFSILIAFLLGSEGA